MTHKYMRPMQDKQAGLSGKVENDTNKLGKGQATQVNEGRRTPQSRHDREDHIGNNQSKMRGGSPQGSNTASPPKSRRRG
jgi:hypothetical protein